MNVFPAILIATACVCYLTEVGGAPQFGNPTTPKKATVETIAEADTGRANVFVEVYEEKKEAAIAEIDKLKTELEAKYRDELIPGLDEAKLHLKRDTEKAKIVKAIEGLEEAREKLTKTT